jgi:hypothetical protein
MTKEKEERKKPTDRHFRMEALKPAIERLTGQPGLVLGATSL